MMLLGGSHGGEKRFSSPLSILNLIPSMQVRRNEGMKEGLTVSLGFTPLLWPLDE